ncbi:S-methyl-5-thioribose kinase [Gluconobacter frateurii]|uniref:S-methyl-5-thioribose kinase n=1 Tax=Gluconobacter frateurii NRIC 0228 TaxID=1307946 RepID=A0ABQ0Q7C6_9PROT|nr:S-methyl-5-thioribose kinase [Gluconobacter frateurii]GBR07779.1 methylthioribose kinase [Gluconobacter frateurii NRIC 0228]GLP91316.1 methylthioribose kinase [Gluconobacter frateurii]
MPYFTLDASSLQHWLTNHADLASLLGGSPSAWTIREVSDGNLNTVFLVDGPAGSLCCKQALPHVRVAPDWPMPLERALYEARYMRATADAVRPAAPELYFYDDEMFLLVMECLTPHEVLRTALIRDEVQPGFSAVIGQYVARSVHATSWISQPFEHGSKLLADFAGNTALTRITVDLILTDPFRPCSRNPAPEADLLPDVEALQADKPLHRAVGNLQERFLTARQALLHGDLHTGSIMQHKDDVRVIDGEFATMGPIGFDCGLYLGNLALHACGAPHKGNLITAEITAFWNSFTADFRTLLKTGGGDVWALSDDVEREEMLNTFLHSILQDTTGFCGLEMIRRTIGFAQVADYTLCVTPESRTEARRKALKTGRTLILAAPTVHNLEGLLNLLTLR